MTSGTGVAARKRLTWMDTVRGIAIVLVLVQHSVTVPAWDGPGGSPVLGAFNEFFQPYRMPTLLVLSGLLLHRSLAKPMPVYASGKVRRILWPLALWTPVVWLLSPPEVWDLSVIGPRHLWFLVVLAACYAVGPLTRWVSPWLIAAAMLAWAVFLPWVAGPLTVVAANGVFFMVGAGLASVLPRWQAAHGAVPAVLAVAAAAWAVVDGWVLVETAHVAVSTVASLAGVAAVLWVAPRLPAVPVMEWVGRNSMAFYIAHAPIMIVLWELVRWAGLENPHLVSAVLLVVAAPACTLLARAGWAQWLFMWPSRRQSAVRAA